MKDDIRELLSLYYGKSYILHGSISHFVIDRACYKLNDENAPHRTHLLSDLPLTANRLEPAGRHLAMCLYFNKYYTLLHILHVFTDLLTHAYIV